LERGLTWTSAASKDGSDWANAAPHTSTAKIDTLVMLSLPEVGCGHRRCEKRYPRRLPQQNCAYRVILRHIADDDFVPRLQAALDFDQLHGGRAELHRNLLRRMAVRFDFEDHYLSVCCGEHRPAYVHHVRQSTDCNYAVDRLLGIDTGRQPIL